MASLQGQVVCRIGDCAHLDTYAGICCTCGSDVIAQAGRKKDGEEREGGEGTHYGMFGSVSHPAFRRSAQSALNEEVRSVSCTHACHVLDPHTNNTHSHIHTLTQTHECTHVHVLLSTKDDGQTSTPVERKDYIRFAEFSTFQRPTSQMERLRSMIKNRKLALVLDLDHTLLHTTMPRSPYQVSILQRICGISDEVFQVLFRHP